MDRQEQIDKICFKFLKWDKTSIGVYMDGTESWYWRDLEKKQSISRTFDPFTNPSDCHTVMQEVIKRGCTYKIDYDPIDQCWSCELAIEQGVGNVGSFESESDAKMMALLEAIM